MSYSNPTTDPRYEDFYKAVEGDSKATQRVIEQFHPLVTKLANKYCFLPEVDMYDDLIQAGRIGVWLSIQTYDMSYRKKDGNLTSPMTWTYSKVRGSVQSVARPNKPNKNFSRSTSFLGSDDSIALIESLPDDLSVNEVEGNSLFPEVEDILLAGCESLDSKTAKIVKLRFGLMGEEPMRPIDIAKAMNISKQQVNGHLTKFFAKVKAKYPEMKKALDLKDSYV